MQDYRSATITLKLPQKQFSILITQDMGAKQKIEKKEAETAHGASASFSHSGRKGWGGIFFLKATCCYFFLVILEL